MFPFGLLSSMFCDLDDTLYQLYIDNEVEEDDHFQLYCHWIGKHYNMTDYTPYECRGK